MDPNLHERSIVRHIFAIYKRLNSLNILLNFVITAVDVLLLPFSPRLFEESFPLLMNPLALNVKNMDFISSMFPNVYFLITGF